MKCLYIGIVFLTYNNMIISGQVLSDDEETFYESEETSYINIDNGTGITERIPWSSRHSYKEHHCSENMSLYLVDDALDIWMCDCYSPFLYFPLNDSCYKAYRQGPCSSKNYLVLPENETLSRCVENPCLEDGVVPYNGACYPLQTIGIPCNPKYILQVDITTFQLMCMYHPSGGDSGGIINDFATRNCPSGSRRSLKSGACIKVRHN